MEQCKITTADGRQCIYVEGHGGDHLCPEDNRDHSDEIRIRVLRDRAELAEKRLELRQRLDDDCFVDEAIIADLLDALDAVEQRAEAAEADLDWIACASRNQIEEMLAQSVCDDVDDMRQWIDAARLKEKS